MRPAMRRYRCAICHQVWWTRLAKLVHHRHWCPRCQKERPFDYYPSTTSMPWPPPVRSTEGSSMTRLVVIDGNPVCYRAFHAPGTRRLQTSTGMKSGLFYGFLRTYLALKKRLPNSHFVLCFDAGRSWRNDACAEYKTHAEDGKPNGFSTQMQDVLSFLQCVGIPTFQEPMLEADDLISVLVSEWVKVYNTAIVVSSDRDYFQLVSDNILLYDDRAKKFYGPKEVENLTGVKLQYFLNYKCLIGDKSDCLSGVYGYGPKRARLICKNPQQTLFGADLQIFERNRHLMQLPRSAEQLPLHTAERRRIRLTINRLFDALRTGYQSRVRDVRLAQELLNYYECKVYKAEDFLLAKESTV